MLLVICPPVWERLPLMGVAYLCESLQSKGYPSSVSDLNIELFNKIAEEYKHDWTINKEYITQEFFSMAYKEFTDLFDGLLNVIKDNDIKHVGFSVFKSNREFSLNTAKFLKEKLPDIKIVFGGPEVYTMSLSDFRGISCVDYFVVGEGEKALVDILTGKTQRRVIQFDQIDDIDFYPLYKEYHLEKYARKNSLPLLFGRGCINNCSFCSERLLFKGFRTRDPENVIEEIKTLKNRYGVKWFTFYDSMINGNIRKFEKLVDLIIEEDLDISWDAQISIRDDMPAGLMENMNRSGCINLFVGLESGSGRILRKMRKNFTPEDARVFLEKLYNAGLQYEVSLIVDYPGERQEDFNDTLNFIIDNRKVIKKIAQLNRFMEYPGIDASGDGIDKEGGEKKIKLFLEVLDAQGIRYTKQFINNLI